jgi:Ala-tRNA(Pro) deacylase
MDVFADGHLREDETIVFNSGSHTELVKLAFADYERLVRPTVAALSTQRGYRGSAG